MRRAFIAAAAAAATVGIAAPGPAQSQDHLAAAKLQWRTMFPGVEFAPAYGDWEKEGHGKFVRFVSGAKVPMHTHTNAYRGVMVSGRMVNLYDGDARLEIGPGDYWFVAARRPHGHECISTEPCFFYTYGDSLWDLQLVEAD